MITYGQVLGLADCYRAVRASMAYPVVADPPDLSARLARLFAIGHDRHPAFSPDPAAFAEHLARCRAPLAPGENDVHAADLFLACAALRGDRAAVSTMRAQCWPLARRYLRSFRTSDATLDEIGQELWSVLLLGRAAGPPKLESYSGKGPLAVFIGITAHRIAISRLRREDTRARAAVRAAAEVGALAHDVELMFVKREYREAFQRALTEALEQLDDRMRMILRMHVVDGLSLERIAQAYRVSQSTISRWLAGTRQSVLGQARRLLLERLPLTTGEVDSLWNTLVSQIDLHVSSLLGAPRSGALPPEMG